MTEAYTHRQALIVLSEMNRRIRNAQILLGNALFVGSALFVESDDMRKAIETAREILNNGSGMKKGGTNRER